MRLVAITFFALATLTENVAGASESADCSDQYQWCEPHDCIYSEVVAFCHKTCGLCGGGSTTDSIVSSEEETTTEVSESTVGSSESGGSCVDEYFSCSSDWCPNHANKCRKTCGLCIQPTPTRRGPVAVTVTADRTDYPEEFTTSDISETREPAIEEENICSDIFPWCRYAPCLVMGVVCRESCGFCDGTGTTTETAEVAETTEETSSTATEIETMEEDTKCSNDYNWCSDTVCKYYGTSCRQSCGLCENAQSTTEGFGIDVNSSYFTEQPSECHDEREHCNVDYCKILENMRTQCKRTCGYCDTSETTEVPFGTTEDTQTTEAVTECNDHYGWCTDSVCKYYGNSCRKSCGLCEAEQSTLDVIETTTETEATENALECQDERHDCTEDACQFYGTSKQCRKTCGLCDMVE